MNTAVIVFFLVALVVLGVTLAVSRAKRERLDEELLKYQQRAEYIKNNAATTAQKKIAKKEQETYEKLKGEYLTKYRDLPDDHDDG